jgi:hypothetical protein
MTNTNPPQERGTNNAGTDRERNVRRITELLRIAEQEFAAQEQRQELAREFGPVLESAFDIAGAEYTCCTRGGTTRQMPCRNSQWWGCPFYENDRGRERSRGYHR